MTASETAAPNPSPALTIDRLVDGVYPAMALLAGMELDLFTIVDRGASTVDAVAAAAATSVEETRLLLDALVAAELLVKQQGRYAVTCEAAEHLSAASPFSRAGSHVLLRRLWTAALQTAATVRAGRPQVCVDYRRLPAAEAEALLRTMGGDGAGLARLALPHLGLCRGDRVVDVGGGAGGAAATFAAAAPDVRSTVVELPNVAPVTRRLLAEAGSAFDVDVIEADATVEVPGTYDVAWLSLVTQTLPPAAAEAVIANSARALSPDGTMHLVNIVAEASRVHPPRAALFNVVLMNLYDGGRVYAVPEYERWLRAAGLTTIRWTPINDMLRLVSARRV